MSTNSPTTDETVLCECGAPSTPANLDLHRCFPKSWKPLCGKCESKRIARDMAIQKEEEERRRMAERLSRLEIIPPEMLRTEITDSRFNAGLWVRVESWRPSGGKWMGIEGGPGRCKTRCLALLCRDLILAGHRLAWTTAVDFQDRVDDLRGENGERKEAMRYMKEIKHTGVLALDDIGKNTWTPTFERHLFALIDYRKTHDLPILWTANTSLTDILKSGQLTKDRGGPIISRLLEASTIERA